jgi:hypothetical protein
MERGQINDSDAKISAEIQYYENPFSNFSDKHEYGQTNRNTLHLLTFPLLLTGPENLPAASS